jgi:AcrR family transcriptional regulator
MSALLNREKRDRARKARGKQRQELIKAAAHAFEKQPYADVKLDAIGRGAGLSGGMASVHFASREELFIEVLRGEIDHGFDALRELLDAAPDDLDGAALADLLAGELAGRPRLTRLIGVLPNALEQNVEILSAQFLVDKVRDRTSELGREFERRCAGFAPGSGAVFLRRLAVLLVGLGAGSNLSGVFAAVIDAEELPFFKVDLQDELRVLIRRILPEAPEV